MSAPGNSVGAIWVVDSDHQKVADDIAQLATQGSTAAIEVLCELFGSTEASHHAEIGATIADSLDEPTLRSLAQTTVGLELLALLQRHGGRDSHELEPKQFVRIRDALQGVASATPSPNGALAQMALAPLSPNVARSVGKAIGAEAAATDQVKSAFKEEFAAKAANKNEFDAFMQQIFGPNYDRSQAEQYRQMALRGDFTFLPEVRFVDAETLRGGKGAYNEAEGVVYINRDIVANDPHLAAQVFVEEAGAHLDAKLNTVDTKGDEGEMFRRVLSGEQLSEREIEAIRNDDDHGTITVDGKTVEVEFWIGEDFVDGVEDVATSAWDKGKQVVSGVVDHVGTAGRNMAYSVGDMVKEGTTGLVDGAGLFIQGVGRGFGGWAINIMQGRFADGWDEAVNGLDKALIEAPRRIINGGLESAGHFLKTTTYLLPEKFGGDLLRSVIDRGIDNFHTIANGAIDICRNFARLPFEVLGGFGRDMGEALRHWARGDVGEGFGRLGLAFVNPFKRVGGAYFDSAMIFGQGASNVVGNNLFVHEPSRGLSKSERDYLHNVYGDSLNLEDIRIHKGDFTTNDVGMAPHTVGNDIYLPDKGPYNCFDPDGSLNEKGRWTLMHEAFHVYQAQHGGNDYIHDALLTQAEGIVGSGNRNKGYDWTVPFLAGKPFNEWNPEAQAALIETMGKAHQGRYDSDGNQTLDTAYDQNGDGIVEQAEFELAWSDQQWSRKNADGSITVMKPDGFVTANQEPALLNLTPEQFQRLVAIWEAVKEDRPDRTTI